MIKIISPLYEIKVHDALTRDFNSDGSPKQDRYQNFATSFTFPQEARDRLYALTDNLQYRLFASGSFRSMIDPAWLFVCFENPMTYREAQFARIASRLTKDQWGFYTFNDAELKAYTERGIAPSVSMFSFDCFRTAELAMTALGEQSFIEELRAPRSGTHVVFCRNYESPPATSPDEETKNA